ncbi:HD-GYP domain-containing protein [Ferdinandcohnia quinoae]|uniref:HD domain-containing protein n=1 Tax=Fredinandcohnia quinoae TaxID=2918902 RepID=A0AAW5E4P2_9BACI|nr:HD domain-containing phosphohydrolase [Fredinandcohnia sp. SECRCQ15]MCH1626210.1 HD domain-containing protein [Fredinandcohnia sp. SECRCQ15]
MEHLNITFDLVGSSLGEDIFSDQGILLLKKGTILKEVHILLLQKYRFGTKVTVDSTTNEIVTEENELSSSKPYKSFQSYIKDTFQLFLKDKYIDLVDLREKYFSLIEVSLSDFSIMRVLQSEVKKEDYLYQHSINVGIFSAIIGKLLGFNKKDCLLLAEMGLWHDIGMFNIDKNILEKEGPLLDDEFQRVQKHTKMGYNLLRSFTEMEPIISTSALLHHERLNGSGYPRQLNESDIPYLVQVISVADCFNAMGMKTNYGEKKSDFAGVYELVKEAFNNRLNPAIVIPFVRYIMRQNLYEKVVLSNGDDAEVIFIHDNEPHQPLVKVQNEYIDLRKDSSLKIVSLMQKQSVLK